MQSCHRAIVASVHSLQHIQGSLITNFSNDDPIWAHTEGINDQLTNCNFTAALNIWWSRFKCNYMLLTQLQFCRILNSYYALISRNKTREDVKESGLTRTSATRDNHI